MKRRGSMLRFKGKKLESNTALENDITAMKKYFLFILQLIFAW